LIDLNTLNRTVLMM